MQEVRNAVDQASREVATRFDFKDTGANVELKGNEIELNAPTEDRGAPWSRSWRKSWYAGTSL